MKKFFLLVVFCALVYPAKSQIFGPGDPEKVPQKTIFGPLQPFEISPSVMDPVMAKYLENARKPYLKSTTYRSPNFDPEWADSFEQALDDIMSANDVPGASLAVYAPGQGLFTAVSGISTAGEPITTEMRFGIASNTKLFVAVTLLRLQEEGVLSLDDPIDQWLPSYPYVDSSATIRQLLNHTSGVFDFWNDNMSMIYDSIWPDTSRFWTTDEVLATIGEPHFLPGHGWSYSNTGYTLAAMVIEAATGQGWAENLNQFVFGPLDLDSTFVGAFEARNGPVANEWDGFNGIEIPDPPMTAEYSQGHGAAAVLSTPQEMVSWYTALFNGGLLNAASMVQLTAFDPVSNYSLGLAATMPYGHLFYNHTGGLLGYISLTLFDTRTGAAFSVMFNGNYFQTDPFFPFITVMAEGFPKMANDAGITDILSPWSNTCSDTVTPVALLTNYGSEVLSSAEIHCSLDDDPVSVYSWTGSLEAGGSLAVSLPVVAVTDGSHTLTCHTALPNGQPEGYQFNDTVTADLYVNLEPALDAPLMEGFDGEDFPPEGWYINSIYAHEWGRTTVASYSGTGSVVKNNYNDGWVGGHYYLDLPLLDISGGLEAELEFRYAYARYPGNNFDSLQVFISEDCGATWDTLFNKGGSLLATAAQTYDLYYPRFASQWKTENFPLGDYTGEVLIRFCAVCGWGNNLYLDDISVDLAIGTGESKPAPDFTVYPNPVADELHVGGLPAGTEITLTDLAGKTLIREKTRDTDVAIDLSGLPDGVYFLKTVLGTRKIVKI